MENQFNGYISCYIIYKIRDLPFGAIFDLYLGCNPKLPVNIIVKYRNYPDNMKKLS